MDTEQSHLEKEVIMSQDYKYSNEFSIELLWSVLTNSCG
jgi:hypothetical protein